MRFPRTSKPIRAAGIVALLLATLSLSAMWCQPAYAAAIDDTELTGKPSSFYASKVAGTLPELSSPRFACADGKGNVYFSRNAHERSKIASVTKIMTAIVVSDYPLDIMTTVSDRAASIPGSSATLQGGDQATLYDLMLGLMLPSGNDAAYALSEEVGRRLLKADGVENWKDTSPEARTERFVREMNSRGEELGLSDSFFANPCGLDDEEFVGEHCSSAADVLKMVEEALDIPAIAEICGKAEAGMLVHRDGADVVIPLYNTNHLLEERNDCLGGKTGFTDSAGGCFAGALDIDGDIYYTVVLGCDNGRIALSECSELWDWTRFAREKENLLPGLSKNEDGNLIVGYLGAPEWLDRRFQAVVRPQGQINREKWYWEDSYRVETELDVPQSGVIKKGEEVGSLVLRSSDGGDVQNVNIIAGETVPTPGLWDRIVVMVSRIAAPLTGEQAVADDELMSVEPKSGKAYGQSGLDRFYPIEPESATEDAELKPGWEGK